MSGTLRAPALVNSEHSSEDNSSNHAIEEIQSGGVRLLVNPETTPATGNRSATLSSLDIRLEKAQWRAALRRLSETYPYLSKIWLHPEGWLSGHFRLGRQSADFAIQIDLQPQIGHLQIRIQDAAILGWVPANPWMILERILRGLFGKALTWREDLGVWNLELGATLFKDLLVRKGWRMPQGVLSITHLEWREDTLELKLNPSDATNDSHLLLPEKNNQTSPFAEVDRLLRENKNEAALTSLETLASDSPEENNQSQACILRTLFACAGLPSKDGALETYAEFLKEIDSPYHALATSISTAREQGPKQQDQALDSLLDTEPPDVLTAFALYRRYQLEAEGPEKATLHLKEAIALGLPRAEAHRRLARDARQRHQPENEAYHLRAAIDIEQAPEDYRALSQALNYKPSKNPGSPTQSASDSTHSQHSQHLAERFKVLTSLISQSQADPQDAIDWMNAALTLSLDDDAIFQRVRNLIDQDPRRGIDLAQIAINITAGLGSKAGPNQRINLARKICRTGVEVAPHNIHLRLSAAHLAQIEEDNLRSQLHMDRAWLILSETPQLATQLSAHEGRQLLNHQHPKLDDKTWRQLIVGDWWKADLNQPKKEPTAKTIISLDQLLRKALVNQSAWNSLVDFEKARFQITKDLTRLNAAVNIAEEQLHDQAWARQILWEAIGAGHTDHALLVSWAKRHLDTPAGLSGGPGSLASTFQTRLKSLPKRLALSLLDFLATQPLAPTSEQWVRRTLSLERGHEEDLVHDVEHNWENEAEQCLDRLTTAEPSERVLSTILKKCYPQPSHPVTPLALEYLSRHQALLKGGAERLMFIDLCVANSAQHILLSALENWLPGKHFVATQTHLLDEAIPLMQDGELLREWLGWCQVWARHQHPNPTYGNRWILLAREARDRHRAIDAAEIYRALVSQQSPISTTAAAELLELGFTQQVSEWIDDALAPLKNTLQSGLPMAREHIDIYLRYLSHAANKPEHKRAAEETARIAVQNDPLHPSALLVLGHCDIEAGRFREAINRWQLITQVLNGNPQAEGAPTLLKEWPKLSAEAGAIAGILNLCPLVSGLAQHAKNVSQHLSDTESFDSGSNQNLLDTESRQALEKFDPQTPYGKSWWHFVASNAQAQTAEEWSDLLNAVEQAGFRDTRDWLAEHVLADPKMRELDQLNDAWRNADTTERVDLLRKMYSALDAVDGPAHAKAWLKAQAQELGAHRDYWEQRLDHCESPGERIGVLEAWRPWLDGDAEVEILRQLTTLHLEEGKPERSLEILIEGLQIHPAALSLLNPALLLAPKVDRLDLRQRLLDAVDGDLARRQALEVPRAFKGLANAQLVLLEGISRPTVSELRQLVEHYIKRQNYEAALPRLVKVVGELPDADLRAMIVAFPPEYCLDAWKALTSPEHRLALLGIAPRLLAEYVDPSIFQGLSVETLLDAIDDPNILVKALGTRIEELNGTEALLLLARSGHRDDARKHIDHVGLEALLNEGPADQIEPVLIDLFRSHHLRLLKLLPRCTQTSKDELGRLISMAVGDIDDATVLFPLLKVLAPEDTTSLTILRRRLVELYVDQQDWPGLETLVSSADPRSAEWYPVLLRLHHRLNEGQTESSITYPQSVEKLRVQILLAQAERVTSSEARAEYIREAARTTWFKLGDPEEARRLFKRAHALVPQDPEAMKTRVKESLGLSGGREDLDRAWELLREWTALGAPSSAPWQAWAWAYRQALSRTAPPQVFLEALLTLCDLGRGPGNSEALIDLAEFAQEHNRPEDKQHLLDAAAGSDATGFDALANSLRQQEQWSDLISALQKRASAFPKERYQRIKEAGNLALEKLGRPDVAWNLWQGFEIEPELLWQLWTKSSAAEDLERRRRHMWPIIRRAQLDVDARAELIRWALEQQSEQQTDIAGLSKRELLEELAALGCADKEEILELAYTLATTEPIRALQHLEGSRIEWDPKVWVDAAMWLFDAGDQDRARNLMMQIDPTPGTAVDVARCKWFLGIENPLNAYRMLTLSGSVEGLSENQVTEVLLDGSTFALHSKKPELAAQWIDAIPKEQRDTRWHQLNADLKSLLGDDIGLLSGIIQQLEEQSELSDTQAAELWQRALDLSANLGNAKLGRRLLSIGTQLLSTQQLCRAFAETWSGHELWLDAFDRWRSDANPTSRSEALSWYLRGIKDRLNRDEADLAYSLFEEFPDPRRLSEVLPGLADRLYEVPSHPGYPVVEEELLEHLNDDSVVPQAELDQEWQTRILRLIKRHLEEDDTEDAKALMRQALVTNSSADFKDIMISELAGYHSIYTEVFDLVQSLIPEQPEDLELLRLYARLAAQVDSHETTYRAYSVISMRDPEDTEAVSFVKACCESRPRAPVRILNPHERRQWISNETGKKQEQGHDPQDAAIETLEAFYIPLSRFIDAHLGLKKSQSLGLRRSQLKHAPNGLFEPLMARFGLPNYQAVEIDSLAEPIALVVDPEPVVVLRPDTAQLEPWQIRALLLPFLDAYVSGYLSPLSESPEMIRRVLTILCAVFAEQIDELTDQEQPMAEDLAAQLKETLPRSTYEGFIEKSAQLKPLLASVDMKLWQQKLKKESRLAALIYGADLAQFAELMQRFEMEDPNREEIDFWLGDRLAQARQALGLGVG